LFQLLKYFEGPLQIIATVILPGAVTTFLVVLPWMDKASSRKASERMPVVAAVAVLLSCVGALTAVAMVEDSNNERFQKGVVEAHKEAEYSRELAKAGVLPAGGEAVFLNDPKVATKNLFKEKCRTCHTIEGVGGEEGPELTEYKSREWLSALIRDPTDKRFFGGSKSHDTMEPYPPKDLPDEKLAAVVEYVTSLIGAGAGPVDAALVEKGKALFMDELDCNTCHEIAPGETADGPNLHHHGSVEWITRVIRNSGADDLFGTSASMPKFEGKLSDDEIRGLAEYVFSQRSTKPSG
jgi:ubiquinol-cytochrome c reductase cytochrome b subunit